MTSFEHVYYMHGYAKTELDNAGSLLANKKPSRSWV